MGAPLDDYREHVGAKHGLARGETGSGRRNKAVEIDEASKRHAEDRAAQIDARAAAIEAERQAGLRDFAEQADLLLKSNGELDAKRAEIELRDTASRRLAAEVADDRAANAAELSHPRRWKAEAMPFVKEGLARRKEEEAERQADEAYRRKPRRRKSDDAALEEALRLEREQERRKSKTQAERQRGAVVRTAETRRSIGRRRALNCASGDASRQRRHHPGGRLCRTRQGGGAESAGRQVDGGHGPARQDRRVGRTRPEADRDVRVPTSCRTAADCYFGKGPSGDSECESRYAAQASINALRRSKWSVRA